MGRDRAQSDREVVLRVQKGDSDAFATLIERHNERIFNMICRLVGQQDAVDLTQDIFLKAFKSIGSFKNASSFSTWLYRITLNTVTSHRRRMAHGTFSHFESPAADTGELRRGVEPASTDPTPQEVLVRREEIEAVQNAIGELEEIDREIIVLRDIEEISYVQIAEVLGIPIGTVKSRLYRARMALRERLKALINAPDEGMET